MISNSRALLLAIIWIVMVTIFGFLFWEIKEESIKIKEVYRKEVTSNVKCFKEYEITLYELKQVRNQRDLYYELLKSLIRNGDIKDTICKGERVN